jgi:hypothetical protein
MKECIGAMIEEHLKSPSIFRQVGVGRGGARSKLMWLSVLNISLTPFQAKRQRGVM